MYTTSWCRHSVGATFVLAVALLQSNSALGADSAQVPGFTAQRAAWELQYEELFKAIPDAEIVAQLSAELSAHPILVASEWNEWNLQRSKAYLEELGLAPEVFTYYPYISTPREVRVEMVEPTPQELRVKEDRWPWQQNFEDVVVGYNAYSPSGDVTAELVYVNYGLPPDYDALEEMGVDVVGKIVIARYGRAFRGVKNNVAYEHGAAGLILYDDPASDGFVLGDVYPEGRWRSPDSIQRGTIQQLFIYPGDPLTPGWAATEQAPRLEDSGAYNLPSPIPTTPLSYGQAAILLESLDGPAAPEDWQGGLSDPAWAEYGGTPFTYHLGGTDKTKVRMMLDIEYSNRPASNLVVKIPGKKYPEELVIIGAHRDGWAYGSGDNTAGFVIILEIARALKELTDEGWRPDRTIVLAGWDGEEYGMLGSTEWGEDHQRLLRQQAVAYINVDAGGGDTYFYAAGVPSLDQLVYDVTQQVTEPDSGNSVYEDWATQSGGERPTIEREGGGSDFAVFLNFLGVPVIDLGYWSDGGNYHSTHDDLYFMEHWGDPGYLHHVSTAQLAGIAALRLANADALPFVYSTYAAEVVDYLSELETLHAEDGLDLHRELAAAERWQSAALELEAHVGSILATNNPRSHGLASKLRAANRAFMQQERELTERMGLAGRPWFRHMIYAPGLCTGYAAEYVPGLTEAADARDWGQFDVYAGLLRHSLNSARRVASRPLPRAARR